MVHDAASAFANHALAGWLGNAGRAVSVLLLVVTVALGLSSAASWLAPVAAVSPLHNGLLLVRTSLLSSMMRDRPEIAMAIVSSTFRHLHALVSQVEQLKAQSGVQRVAEFLASLSSTEQGTCAIALPYDKILIAARLGLTPESLSRAFAKLRGVGVVINASQVTVEDIAKLRRIATDDRNAVRGTLRPMR